MGKFQRGLYLSFGQLIGAALDHDHTLLVGRHHEVQIALGLNIEGRVDDELPVDAADADCGDGAQERYCGQVQSGSGGVQGNDVWVVSPVGTQYEGLHQDFPAQCLREKRAERAVDQPTAEDFLVARSSFPLEKTAWHLAAGIHPLAVVHHEREIVFAHHVILCLNGGGEHDGLAVLGQHGAIGLPG